MCVCVVFFLLYTNHFKTLSVNLILPFKFQHYISSDLDQCQSHAQCDNNSFGLLIYKLVPCKKCEVNRLWGWTWVWNLRAAPCFQVGDLGTLATIPASAATAGASEEGCAVEAKVAAAAEVVDEVQWSCAAFQIHLNIRDLSLICRFCRFFPSASLSGRYEYSQNFRDSQSSDGSVQVPSEFGTNMVYYYDDGNKVQMYTVDEKLLKEYIKRQMWVFDISNRLCLCLYNALESLWHVIDLK